MSNIDLNPLVPHDDSEYDAHLLTFRAMVKSRQTKLSKFLTDLEKIKLDVPDFRTRVKLLSKLSIMTPEDREEVIEEITSQIRDLEMRRMVVLEGSSKTLVQQRIENFESQINQLNSSNEEIKSEISQLEKEIANKRKLIYQNDNTISRLQIVLADSKKQVAVPLDKALNTVTKELKEVGELIKQSV